MFNPHHWLPVAISLLSRAAGARIAIPAANGTYTVGWAVVELNNTDSVQPFTSKVEVPDLMLSVFYPTNEEKTVHIPYMDPGMAAFEGLEQAQLTGLDTNAETFQPLSLQLAANGSSIAQPKGNGGWPVLIFGSASGTTRLFYSALLSEVASNGYVVIAYDTPYDTDIVVYPDGRNITANKTVAAALNTGDDAARQPVLSADFNVRAQDASFIITSFSNRSFAASVIPGCTSCMNTTHVGFFGHSVGGGTAVTLMRNDTRVAGGLDFDGAVPDHASGHDLDRPFMLMAVAGQTREGAVAEMVQANWAQLWAHLHGPSFDLILNNALHYTYSDFPLIFDLLGILPTNQSLQTTVQVTAMNGTRAHHIVTTYAVTFFDWLLKGASDDLLKNTSVEFPEVSVDTGETEVFSNGTVLSATNGTVISRGSSGPSGVKSSATRTSLRRKWFWALGPLAVLLLAA